MSRRLAREMHAREQAETLLEQKSRELFQQAREREAVMLALRESEERYRLMVEFSPNAVLIESNGKIVFTNPAARLLFAETETDLLTDLSLLDLANPTHRLQVSEELARIKNGGAHRETEEIAVRRDGTTVAVAVQRIALRFNGCDAVQMMARDISLRKQLEERLVHQANHDALTGIANRLRIVDIIGETLAYARRYDYPVWVGFLDLDRFKFINDHYGHHVGDELLIAVTRRLQSVLRSSDVVGRYGGDEFVLVLRGGPTDGMNSAVVERIMTAVCKPMMIEGHPLQLTCSLGIASYPNDGDDAQTLIEHADTAMYGAKENGRNLCQFYTSEMNLKHRERNLLESALHTVLDTGQLFLEYQPQVQMESFRIVGVEALLRWQHPQLGLLSPDRFLAIAESNGTINQIGTWILQEACRQCVRWQRGGQSDLRVAVNLSANQLSSRQFAGIVQRALADSGLAPDRLELELSESLMMADIALTSQVLTDLRALGVRIAIDDFGTGYSSFAHLKRLPLDRLKIDQSFVNGLEDDEENQTITRTLIQLAHNLNMNVIAEGVETAFQLDFLKQHGCDEIQGYIFSKAHPAPIIEDMLHKQGIQAESTQGRANPA